MAQSTKDMIKKALTAYKSVGSVYSPALKEDVVFNRQGFNHLLVKGSGHRRSKNDIRRRLHMLPFAPDVIKKCKTLASPPEERAVKVSGKKKAATFYEIQSFTDRNSRFVKVIIRKFPNGSLHFYSIRGQRGKPTKSKRPR